MCVPSLENATSVQKCWVSDCPHLLPACPYVGCESWGNMVPGWCCGDFACQLSEHISEGPCSAGAGEELRRHCQMVCGQKTEYVFVYRAAGKGYTLRWWCSPRAGCHDEAEEVRLLGLPSRCYLRWDGTRLAPTQSEVEVPGYRFYITFTAMSGTMVGIALCIPCCGWILDAMGACKDC